jgi:hypothetical protein
MNMEVTCSSKTLVDSQQTTWRYITGNKPLYNCCYGNPKSYNSMGYLASNSMNRWQHSISLKTFERKQLWINNEVLFSHLHGETEENHASQDSQYPGQDQTQAPLRYTPQALLLDPTWLNRHCSFRNQSQCTKVVTPETSYANGYMWSYFVPLGDYHTKLSYYIPPSCHYYRIWRFCLLGYNTV